MATKIIVGIDGSDSSFDALRWAALEARRHDAGIRVIACYTAPTYGGLDGAVYPSSVDIDVLKEEAETDVRKAMEIVAAIDPDLVVDGITLLSSAVVGIAESALTGDEIVVGATGRTGLLNGVIGSVAAGLTHRAHVPVIVVPAGRPSGEAVKRIVVGVDGSPESLTALEWAYAEALASSAKLTVVHAWEYPYDVSRSSMREIRKPMETAAINELRTSLESLGPRLTDGSVQCRQQQPAAHRTCLRALRVRGAVAPVSRVQPFGDQHLDRPADQFSRRPSEDVEAVRVGQQDGESLGVVREHSRNGGRRRERRFDPVLQRAQPRHPRMAAG